jgi:hypothetical protein
MQLTWSKIKPAKSRGAMFLEQTEHPFYLEPLSLRASIHFRDRNSRCRPHKPRKFRFVTERVPGRERASTESRGTKARNSIHQSDTTIGGSINQCRLVSSLIGTLDDSTQGEMRHPILIFLILMCTRYEIATSLRHSNEESDILDPFTNYFEVDNSSDPLDWWSWFSTATMGTENPNILGELDDGCNAAAMVSAIENADGGDNSFTPIFKDPEQKLMGLGSPVLYESLFGKFEPLLHMCKNYIIILPRLSLMGNGR